MEIKILFDKNTERPKLKGGWGFSAFAAGVLFDTGESGGYLVSNLAEENIAIASVEAVVISHDHWDHIGGLWDILKIKNGLKVYGCPGFSPSFVSKVKNLGAEFVPAAGRRQIKPGAYVTGPISGFYKSGQIEEQALVLQSGRGLAVLCGCAHPGVIRIAARVKELFPGEKINFMLGGFHLINKEKREIDLVAGKLKELGIGYAGPCHCTGYQAQQIFRRVFKDKYIDLKAGSSVNI